MLTARHASDRCWHRVVMTTRQYSCIRGASVCVAAAGANSSICCWLMQKTVSTAKNTILCRLHTLLEQDSTSTNCMLTVAVMAYAMPTNTVPRRRCWSARGLHCTGNHAANQLQHSASTPLQLRPCSYMCGTPSSWYQFKQAIVFDPSNTRLGCVCRTNVARHTCTLATL